MYNMYKRNDNDDESIMTETATQDQEEDDEYGDLLVGLNQNETDLIDSDGNNNNNNTYKDDEKKNDDNNKHLSSPRGHGRSQSKTPLMDIVDPKGTGKWIDIEDESVEQQQSNVLRTSLQKENSANDDNDK